MKNEFLRGLFRLGIPGLLRGLFRRKLLILGYHGFRADGDPGAWAPFLGNHLPAASFRAQLEYLCRHYRPLPLDEALDRLRAGTLPDNAVVLTSDDGYASVHDIAFPLLEEYRVPMTVFLSTGFMDGDEPLWFVRVLAAVMGTDRGMVRFRRDGVGRRFSVGTPSGRRRCQEFLNAWAKNCPQEEREALLEEIDREMGVRPGAGEPRPSWARPMTWDQARHMASSGLVAFGAHGHSHLILSRCRIDTARDDVARSVARIREELGRTPFLFAYPNGEEGDFDEGTALLLEQNGLRAAVTTINGLNTAGTPRFALRRVPVLAWMDIPAFALQLVFVLQLLTWMARWPVRTGQRIGCGYPLSR